MSESDFDDMLDVAAMAAADPDFLGRLELLSQPMICTASISLSLLQHGCRLGPPLCVLESSAVRVVEGMWSMCVTTDPSAWST